MEKIQLTDFKSLIDQLRGMPIDDNLGLIYPIVKYKTIHSTIFKLKKEGLSYTTRSRNGNVYIWRTA